MENGGFIDARTEEITCLLKAWGSGDEAALGRLAERVYPELRRMARQYMKNEVQGNSLQATALVHEVYLRLVDVTNVEWRARAQFFAIVAQIHFGRDSAALARTVRAGAAESRPK